MDFSCPGDSGGESMNECVAGISFGGKHDIESVTGSAGLYRIRAVCFFPVPDIPVKVA